MASFIKEYVEYFALKPVPQNYWHDIQWWQILSMMLWFSKVYTNYSPYQGCHIVHLLPRQPFLLCQWVVSGFQWCGPVVSCMCGWWQEWDTLTVQCRIEFCQGFVGLEEMPNLLCLFKWLRWIIWQQKLEYCFGPSSSGLGRIAITLCVLAGRSSVSLIGFHAWSASFPPWDFHIGSKSETSALCKTHQQSTFSLTMHFLIHS